MGRLSTELVERARTFSHRVVDVAEVLDTRRSRSRIVDQMMGCGPTVGANTHEADEAMSRKDFTKCLCTVLKELSECEFWLGFVGDRGWVRPKRLILLREECRELRRIFGTMVARIRRADRQTAKSKRRDQHAG